MSQTKYSPNRRRTFRKPGGVWRQVTHIQTLHRTYWLTLECGHFKAAKRSIPKCFSAFNEPRFAPHRVRCTFCLEKNEAERQRTSSA